MTDPTNTIPESYQSGMLKPCPFCKSIVETEPYMNGKDLVHKAHLGSPRKCTTIYIISNSKYRSKKEVKVHWNRRVRT